MASAGDTAGRMALLSQRQDMQDQRSLNTARADAEWLTKDAENRNSFKDDDQEYQTWGDRYQKSADEIRRQIAEQHIQDPREREVWMLRRQGDVVRGRALLEGRAETRNRDFYRATGIESLGNLEKTYRDAGDDENMRREVIKAGQGVVEDMRRRGVLTDEQALEAGKRWTLNVSKAEIESLTPLERIAVLGGNQAALRARESSNNPAALNQFGYAGLYQFGAPRLQTLGVYQPGSGENMGAWSKTPRDAAGKWSGQFNIPGFPEVKTMSDFLRNVPAQEAVYRIDDAFKEKEITDNGLDRFVGQNVGGVTITRDGLKNMIHLGGAGGAKAALESNGANDRTDANGTSLLEYARLGAGATSPRATRMAEFIPQDQRERIIRSAESEYVQGLRQEDLNRRNASAELETMKRDHMAALENGQPGLAPERLSRDKIAEIQGEEAARLFEEDARRAQSVGEATKGIQLLPDGEIYTRLETLAPKPNAEGFTTEGYSRDVEAYNKARAKAERFMDARRADPANSADAFSPVVQQAKASAQYEERNGIRSIVPASAQAIIGARLSVQSQMGIDNPMAVTRSEASVIARNLRAIGEENPDQLRRFLDGLQRTYGEYADEVLASTLQHANVNRDLSVMATQLLNKIANGTAPKTAEMKRFETITDAAALENLMRVGSFDTMPLPPERRGAQARTPEMQAKMRASIDRRDRAPAMAERAMKADEAPPLPVDPQVASDVKLLISDNAKYFRQFDEKYGEGASERRISDLMRRTGAKSPEELKQIFERGTL